MQVVVEFYRIREEDDAHAVLGREFVEAGDLDGAIAVAWLMAQTLDMPQLPDALTITDANGETLYSSVIGADGRR